MPIPIKFALPGTDSRVAEQAAERFFALSRALLCVIDPERALIVGTPAAEAVLGYAPEELSELALTALLHPDDRARVESSLSSASVGASDAAFRCRLRRSDGAYRTIAWQCAPPDESGVVFATGSDVTEELRSTERLRVSEERFRALTDCSPMGVYETDLRGTVIYANRRLQEIWGAGHSELADGSWIERVHAADVAGLLACLEDRRTIASEQEGTYRLLLNDGALRRVKIRSAPRLDEAGVVVGTIGTVEDVTERWVLEEQLRQAQKMEAVGQLAGGVAHDFNNLLTVIKTYSEFMLEQIEEASPLRADAIEIQKAAGRAAALTRQLLAFSRKQVLIPRAINLNEIVHGMEPMLRRLIGEDIGIELRTAAQLGAVKADASQLEQVVMNLSVNARDAMSNGGTITIETSSVVLTETTRAGHGVIPGPYVSLVVRDSGCGMDRATRARVFEPFFTTKELGRGTGLGLSMVYGIVKQSEGYIWCDSTEGVGTTFTVLFPQVVDAGSAAQLPDEAAADRASGVVLVTEDEDTVRALSRRILEREGYTVLEARDGREAIRVAAGYPSRIDLLVTDMVMPHVGGSELFAHLRILRPDLRVLFVSGYTDDDIIRRGLKDAVSAFLQKPFTARTLAAAARAALTA
ncbi:MAG: multi-sensor hybrid histidine kinase [Gemmatimonadetes bacterium]|nr:multi-sensor hybrid histidine kinase [Gemmatimonadota bacterium]